MVLLSRFPQKAKWLFAKNSEMANGMCLLSALAYWQKHSGQLTLALRGSCPVVDSLEVQYLEQQNVTRIKPYSPNTAIASLQVVVAVVVVLLVVYYSTVYSFSAVLVVVVLVAAVVVVVVVVVVSVQY